MFRNAFRNLLRLDDPPERTALAFAIGVFIAFLPILGIHTILAVIISIIWRFNKIAVFTAIYINNPWTLGPIIAASWAVGKLLIGAPPIDLPQFTLSAMMTVEFWKMIGEQWHHLVPFVIGGTILSVTGAGISYPLTLYLLRRYHRKYPRAVKFATESGSEK